jgi:hypothetical protein
MLRSAIDGATESREELRSFDSRAEREFGHYELVLNEDGSAVELGRGAMGVTYKAFDPELRCPVALKEIGERHLGDEVALRRFLREARAAASLRHPNVASVFHLGRMGRSYFYAMEFVKGETLERSPRSIILALAAPPAPKPIIMLAGLISRWISSFPCIPASPAATCETMSSARVTSRLPERLISQVPQ